MTIRYQMEAFAKETETELVFFDDLDEALLGFMDRFGPQGHYTVAIYDRAKCIAILAAKFPGTELERYAAAVEWMDYNVEGAYCGEATPGFLTVPDEY
jgi:hypothetical protein